MSPIPRPRSVIVPCYCLALLISVTVLMSAQAEELADAVLLQQADFYRPDNVQPVNLSIAPEDLDAMLAALPERIYVPGSFRWGDISINKVAVRFKGNSSSRPEQRHKRSFLVKFDKYDKDAEFLGLRRISLDNGIQFGSLLSEPVITEILADLGVPCHRANYARLHVNGQYRGVYVNVERIDETFIQRRFPGTDGVLLKADEGGPGGNLQFIGDNPSIYKQAFESKLGSATHGRQRLVELIRSINRPSKSSSALQLASIIELDHFLSTTAVMLLSGAFDQLTGWNPHNYYLYHDPSRDLWHYLPWDLDVGFCEVAFGKIQVLEDWHAAWPVPRSGAPNPLLERVIADPKLLQRYRQVAREVLEKHFQPDSLCQVIDAKYRLIRPDLDNDPFPPQRATNPTDRSYDDIVASIKSFVHKRYALAKAQLAAPGERPPRTSGHRGPDGMPPQINRKLDELHPLAQRALRAGKDLRPVQELMQRVAPLLQQRKMDEAEKLIDRALDMVRKLVDQTN